MAYIVPSDIHDSRCASAHAIDHDLVLTWVCDDLLPEIKTRVVGRTFSMDWTDGPADVQTDGRTDKVIAAVTLRLRFAARVNNL